MEVLHSNWLDPMLIAAGQERVGIVGATLLYPDETIQHVGLFPNEDGSWFHPYRGMAADYRGEHDELIHVRETPAVTAACLLIRRDLFERVGGFDERYPVTHNDVDLCQRVRAAGYRVVVTPHARLLHYESLTRGYAVAEARP
jgi:GT2 family glycosyltransferase